MLLLRTSALPEASAWSYELKMDGYRALAIKASGKVMLRSRNNNDFNGRYPAVAKALATIPDETVLDGEVVALDATGRPSFNLLQNYGSAKAAIVYYVFDVLILAGRDVMAEPLSVRRQLLREKVLPKLEEPIRYCPELNASLSDVIAAVRAQGLEGIVAKRLDSTYEPGQRSGAWRKMRINQGQELVIGGYTTGSPFDGIIYGYYDGDQLLYAGRTRSGFTPAIRADLMRKFQPLEIAECPFANLPERSKGRWGQGLTAEKMAICRWLKPVLVGQFEFVEWTAEGHLRHSKFIGLRKDKKAQDVRREN